LLHHSSKEAMNWAVSAYGLIFDGIGILLFLILGLSFERNSVVQWHVSIAFLAACLSAGLLLVSMGTIGRRPVASDQVKGLVLMSSLLVLFFILAVLWSSAIHEDDLVACSIPIPESYGLTRCDFALGQSVLPWVNGIGLLSSAIVLVSTVRLLQKMPSGVIHT